MDNKITYLEVKQALEATKEAIKEAELNIQIQWIIKEALEKAIKKYPKPEGLLSLNGK
mgnify:CR=1 FL=1|tara:strand:+ start:905 stop:1078 length:174 start_codon:yes stop_codon:yes gene_type:complete